jgi:hypothetical protein
MCSKEVQTPLGAVRVFVPRCGTDCAGNARSRPLSILKTARLPIANDRATL